MSAPIKGYSSENYKGSRFEYATVEPVRQNQWALSVNAHQFVRVVGVDAAEAASTTNQIVATAHAALKGDVINFTSGALIGIEVKVASVAANAINIAEDLSSAPGVGDTFQILRHKYPVADSAGAVLVSSSGPVQFVRDAVNQNVVEDTAVPASNIALPVRVVTRSVDKARLDYSVTNVTTAAYVQLIAATAGYSTTLDIFDSSGETLVFALGAAAAEVDQFYITPGGVGPYNVAIPAGSRVSVKAVSATAAVGEIDLNLFG